VNRCVLILPYFGKFHNYFTLFLETCRSNNFIDWLIFTDDRQEFDCPPNVHVEYMSFTKFKEILSSHFDFEIVLNSPYKLCDFKPTYGYTLQKYIKGYEYWGHCDCDLIFGNLSKFLFPLFDKGYNKIFAEGHLTLYRNTEENNKKFMLPYKGRLLYKEFLSDEHICWFDEDWKDKNVHSIFLNLKDKVYSKDFSINPSGRYAQFIMRKYNDSNRLFFTQKYEKSAYVWNKGSLQRYTKLDNKLAVEEFLYMHFQHRVMKLDSTCLGKSLFQILPNKFIPLDTLPNDVNDWRRMSKAPIGAYKHTIDMNFQRIQRKIKHFFNGGINF
jgi:hypothetical protein